MHPSNIKLVNAFIQMSTIK